MRWEWQHNNCKNKKEDHGRNLFNITIQPLQKLFCFITLEVIQPIKMRDIRLQFCSQNESLWPLCDSQQNLNRQRQRTDLLSIWKTVRKKKFYAKLKLGLGGRTLWLSYYTLKVLFVFFVCMNETKATGSKGAVLYESQGLEGSRCKMKCINVFCAHAGRSVANSLWRENQFGFKATNYWSVPIIHSSYSYFALTLPCSLPHSFEDHSDFEAFFKNSSNISWTRKTLACPVVWMKSLNPLSLKDISSDLRCSNWTRKWQQLKMLENGSTNTACLKTVIVT